MARIAYIITRDGDEWAVTRDGEQGMSYLTQEAAFEAAVGAAGGDLRSGYDIVVQASAVTDPSGASDLGGKPIEGDGFHN